MKPIARKKKASAQRRAETRRLLLEAARRITKAGTLTALAKLVHRDNQMVSSWIKTGEVPPYVAAEILRKPGINPKGLPEITLEQLSPKLF